MTDVDRHRGREALERLAEVEERRGRERAQFGQRERDLAMLHDVAFAAGRALDVDSLSAFALKRAREVLRVDRASLYLWDAEVGVLRRSRNAAVPEDDGSPLSLRPGEGAAGAAFERRAAVAFDDYPAQAHRTDATAIASAMSTPLLVGDQLIGALSVGSFTPRSFTPEEIRLCGLLSAELAPAIEASRMLALARHAAEHDPLTDLPNRASLVRRLRDLALAPGARRSLTALFVDIDRFREVNDAFGHAAGDGLLRSLASRLGGVAAEEAIVGRVGADEFVVGQKDDGDGHAAGETAERVLESLREPMLVSGHPVYVTASIGTAISPERGIDPEDLLRRAEAAMRVAKISQARTVAYHPAMDPQSQRKIARLGELRAALERGQLELHYQPQVDFETGSLVGAEALLRWRHPERGLVPPVEFIPLAEETGLIVELTPWVIARALEQLAAWRSSGLAIRVSVNIAMRNLRDPAFVGTVDRLLRSAAPAPGIFGVEVTEGTIMLETERTIETLGALRAMGLSIAIDDFGTGYSSLSHVGRLPADELKVDKSFVMNIAQRGNRAIVEAVVQLGKAFGLRVVAEGVKDEPTWNAARALHCDVAQGFHVSRPVPPDELACWARSKGSASAA